MRIVAAWMVLAASGTAPGQPYTSQPLFDWSVANAFDPKRDVVPAPRPGVDLPAGHDLYQQLYIELFELDLHLTAVLTDATAPANGSIDPDALSTVMEYVPRLDFVLADIENPDREQDMLLMVDQVRSHPDPSINNAAIGNYANYPGPFDWSAPFPDLVDRSHADNFYVTSGMDAAMPNAFPYQYFEVHASPFVWGGYITPNDRAALFWAPLERVSLAKRHLPPGHMLIPYIRESAPWNGYDADPLPPEDHAALLRHMRMRGVDGYMVFFSPVSYSQSMKSTWDSMEWIFEGETPPEILNLDTDKVSGVQWSGLATCSAAMILVSNLGSLATTVQLPDLPGLPAETPIVPPGTHLQLLYPLLPGAGGADSSGEVSTDDLITIIVNWGGCLPAPENCEGDVNGDQIVNAEDLIDLIVNSGGCSAQPVCAADIDQDGVIGGEDLVEMIVQWGPCPSPVYACPADVNADGVVDGNDLIELMLAWGACGGA